MSRPLAMPLTTFRLGRLEVLDARHAAVGDELGERLEHQVRVDRATRRSRSASRSGGPRAARRTRARGRSAGACPRARGGGARRPTASSAGIGARSGRRARSDRIRMLTPSAERLVGLGAHALQRRAPCPSGPSATGHVMSSVCAAKIDESTWRSFSQLAVEAGSASASTSWCACSGVSSSRLRSEPTPVPTLITIASRIGSIGGLVTCANSCLK